MTVGIKNIKNYDIITFDIFDTLLVRMVNNPADVFLLTGYNCKNILKGTPEQYVEERLEAARIAASLRNNGECSLEDIYNCLTRYSKAERTILMEAELSVEKSVLKPNKCVREIYVSCVDEKKKIIAVSDMYLSAAFLTEVLKDNGYDRIEEVVVSCEHSANKRSGELFEIVEEKFGHLKYLHIGDSWRSDYINPRRKGWDACHIRKSGQKKGSVPQVLSENSSEMYGGDYFSKVGYRVLGPIVFEFDKWLSRNISAMGIDTILFFSRDGKILKKVYDIMYPSKEYKSEYFHISRKAINTATLWMHPEFDNLREYIEDTYSFTIETFLRRVGLFFDHEQINIQGFDLNRVYLAEDFWKNDAIKRLYEEQIKEKAIANSRKQYEWFCKYFKSSVVPGKLAVVDIGWRGSMQNRLEGMTKLLEDAGITDVYGFYLGIESNDINKHGFLYKGSKQSYNKSVVDAGVGLFETLFLANEGTTLRYKKQKNAIIPVLDEVDSRSVKDNEVIYKMHEGAVDYVSDMDQFRMLIDRIDEKRDCFDKFRKLCLSPSKNDLDQFGEMHFNDTVDMALVTKKGLLYYIKRPRALITDYHAAPWKIGFLKENISRTVKWGALYMFLKNITQ